MKIQSLAIIFIIIILPISLVLSEYIKTQTQTIQNEQIYDKKLLNCTYDAIKAYQLNTVNNAFGDVTTKKVEDVEAAANTFFNSLTSNFNFTGYNSDVMKEYVPAIVFTMYDGYYAYSPFLNKLTGIAPDGYDQSFSMDGETQVGLKPYVYYTSRYKRINDDFIIIYTLDNYITIQGKVNGEYHYDYGYLYSIANNETDRGIYYNDTTGSYWFGGVEFKENDTEELKEFVGNEQFSYAKINGKKYYIDPDYYVEKDDTGKPINWRGLDKGVDLNDGDNTNDDINIGINGNVVTINPNAGIFFIDSDGKKNYNQCSKGYDVSDGTFNAPEDNENYLKYYFAITKNKSAYEYFKNAYEFSKAVLDTPVDGYKDKGQRELNKGYNLKELKSSDSYIYQKFNTPGYIISNDITDIREYGDFEIFGGEIEGASSNFDQHRRSVIRYVIETNLSTAIASYSSGASSSTSFIMPKISETDWETIENDVCAISFLQGMKIGSKEYNGYAVVANNLTKEYIDENDIYILAEDVSGNKIYCKPHDKNFSNNTYMVQNKDTSDGSTTNYYPGIWKLNFETKQDPAENGTDPTIIYRPLSYWNNDPIKGVTRVAYLGSYTSIMGGSGINYGITEYPDLYTYMNKLPDSAINIKKAYYVGLARERMGAFNINNINYEIYQGNDNAYFLEDYNDEIKNCDVNPYDVGGNIDPGGGGGSTDPWSGEVNPDCHGPSNVILEATVTDDGTVNLSISAECPPECNGIEGYNTWDSLLGSWLEDDIDDPTFGYTKWMDGQDELSFKAKVKCHDGKEVESENIITITRNHDGTFEVSSSANDI